MNDLRFRPIPTPVAQKARETLRDDYGHSLRVQTGETAPCRHCLRITQPHEDIVLLSYNPFGADHGPYSEIGPIFVHAEACTAYTDEHELPPDFANRELVLRAYDRKHAIADSTIAAPGTAAQVARAFFQDPGIAYIHVRHTTYGCYDFKIERT